MRKLTSFETNEAEVKFASQSNKTKGVYSKMLDEPEYAGSYDCADELDRIADEILQEDTIANEILKDGANANEILKEDTNADEILNDGANADEILKEDAIMTKNYGEGRSLASALNKTNSQREYFDSFNVGEIVGVNSYLAGDNIDEHSPANAAIRRDIRRKATFNRGPEMQAGARTAKIISKTDYTLTVEYVPMHPSFGISGGSANMSTPWRESFKWNDLAGVYKLQR